MAKILENLVQRLSVREDEIESGQNSIRRSNRQKKTQNEIQSMKADWLKLINLNLGPI